MESFEGEVVEVLFYNQDNAYTVAVLEDNNSDQIITFVGNLPEISVGEEILIRGEWLVHKTYGRQIKVEYFEAKLPNSTKGIERYLSSGLIAGIGPAMAHRIVEKFGIETLDIIQNQPERLMEVSGIGKKKLESILKSYYQNLGLRQIVMELGQYGMTVNQCIKIYKKFKDRSLEVLKKNPYEIADKVSGIGFKIMDKIAQNMGLESDSPDRIQQGILYMLKLASAGAGHSFLPQEILVRETGSLLDVQDQLIEDELPSLAFEGKIHIDRLGDQNLVYLIQFYIAENYSCKKLIQLSTSEKQGKLADKDIDEIIKKIEGIEGIDLAEKQKLAVREAINSGLMILTGGPGTGKTTTVNTIIGAFEHMDLEVVLAAPTGRAAKRMSETTNRSAKTVHRLLEMNFDDADTALFLKNEEDPIIADVIIVDEASMVDIQLMYNLLKAISPGTRLILVGDSDQLPSVGPGNVLRDVINSGVVKVVMLDEIFRQAKESLIVMNAHRINRGEKLVINNKDSDFFFIPRKEIKEIEREIIGLVEKRIPGFLGVDRLKEIQILSPMRKGELGVTRLNEILQQALNPKANSKTEEIIGKRIFRLGDKVMQVKNNYEKSLEDEFEREIAKGIYNGDIGYIYHIDKVNKRLFVIFDDEKIAGYDYDELDELDHCFATTIHKSQGSEFPVVIIPITWGPPMLLNRNLIYTAVTRAKKLAILVGDYRYLEMMVNNANVNSRFSNLDFRLRKMGDFLEEND